VRSAFARRAEEAQCLDESAFGDLGGGKTPRGMEGIAFHPQRISHAWRESHEPHRSPREPCVATEQALLAGSLEGLAETQNPLLHDLAGLETNGRTGRDLHVRFRFLGIASHSFLAHPDFEDSEVPKLDGFVFCQAVRNRVEHQLNDLAYFALDYACLVADRYD
jgi:hypothetical protein